MKFLITRKTERVAPSSLNTRPCRDLSLRGELVRL
jgi:hypothetical protein